jgi:hypothetical protein
MARGEFNGNPVVTIAEDGFDIWRYADNLEKIDFYHPRCCPYCKQKPTAEGHDACLGTLPNVKFACCGHHSSNGHPYVIFNDDTIIDFDSTEEMLKYFKLNP